MLRENRPMVLTFIYYSVAFDSVGHKFLDIALGEAKVKPKTRAILLPLDLECQRRRWSVRDVR